MASSGSRRQSRLVSTEFIWFAYRSTIHFEVNLPPTPNGSQSELFIKQHILTNNLHMQITVLALLQPVYLLTFVTSCYYRQQTIYIRVLWTHKRTTFKKEGPCRVAECVVQGCARIEVDSQEEKDANGKSGREYNTRPILVWRQMRQGGKCRWKALTQGRWSPGHYTWDT